MCLRRLQKRKLHLTRHDDSMPHPIEAASLVFKEATGKECEFEEVESDAWDLVSVDTVELDDGLHIPCDCNKLVDAWWLGRGSLGEWWRGVRNVCALECS